MEKAYMVADRKAQKDMEFLEREEATLAKKELEQVVSSPGAIVKDNAFPIAMLAKVRAD